MKKPYIYVPNNKPVVVGKQLIEGREGVLIIGTKAQGPRGDYYTFAFVCKDCILFGDEQGNYAGGITVYPEMRGDYELAVLKNIEYIQKNDPEFYHLIKQYYSKNPEQEVE